MPWKVSSAMSQRLEFVTLALQEGAHVRELCRRFGISPKTGYKWLHRYRADGPAALADQSRRPRTSPDRTPTDQEDVVVALRREQPAWGGRKLRRRLQDLGHADVPAASTITAILRRHDLLPTDQPAGPTPWQRFEAEAPNRLWQMDFKGHFPLDQGRCHPLTVLDDHSRYALGLVACGDEQTATVQAHLTAIFRRYGLPERLLCDNGPPWGSSGTAEYTPLAVWLLRLDVHLGHGRPYHPQTQGKDERFHRTLTVEVLQGQHFRDLPQTQTRFDGWRSVYNHERPHQALDGAVPARRYQASVRSFPETLPVWAYDVGDQVRRVQADGTVSFQGRPVRLGRAFVGEQVAVRATTTDGYWEVVFGRQVVAAVDFRYHNEHA